MKSKKNRALAIANHGNNESVKKHVSAIHTSGELSLLERKMANVFLLNAYDDLLTRKTHSIHVRILSAMLGWDESNNIERLQSALKKLTSTAVVFDLMEDDKGSWAVVSMLSFGEIKDGVCSYRYDEYLADKLYDPEVYATINISIQRQLNGGYSLALYENCLRYKNVGSTGWWDIGKFRRLIGAESDYYNAFKVLNAKIIKPSVEEINKTSDIFIEPEFRKESRKVVAVRFLVQENAQNAIFKQEEADEFTSIREMDSYKRLIEHGVGDKLAITWILQDEDRVRAVVDYVEARDRRKQVKGSTAGYIRKLLEDRAEVGKTPYEARKEQGIEEQAQTVSRQDQQKKRSDLEAAYRREMTTDKINSLSLDERKKLVLEYFAEVGEGKGNTYDDESGEFGDSLERFQFYGWLRKRFSTTFLAEDFEQWLNTRLMK